MANGNGKGWPPTVTIFGAGIAGLTAAHELSERGFIVFVYEAEPDPRSEANDCQVGGMARSQWRRIDVSEAPEPESADLPPPPMKRLEPVVMLRERIQFDENSAALSDEAKAELSKVVEKLNKYPEIKSVYVDGVREAREEERVALERAEAVREQLTQRGVDRSRLTARALGSALMEDRALRPEKQRCVIFELAARSVPGEHGYRFFPSFYKHLFDSMRRTPILEETRAPDLLFARKREFLERMADKNSEALAKLGLSDEKLVELGLLSRASENVEGRVYRMTERTAYDNLVPLASHEIDRADGLPPEHLPRQRPSSVTELMRMMRALFCDMRFSPRDVGLFGVKVLKYATSCDARRREYESMTWLEFIESHRYSSEFQQAMERWPQALVAMRASQCDARTYGNTTLQLLLDMARVSFTDGTLNGPTSEAWLDPWRRYLERVQGVRFVRGELKSIKYDWEGSYLKAVVEGANVPVPRGYVVVALPIEHIPKILTEDLVADLDEWNRRRSGQAAWDNTLRAARDFALMAASASDPSDSLPTRALADFSGIQFFFEGDIHFVDGHTYFPDSEWGLSAIAQAHFRKDRLNWRTSYRGVLSVDIGQWHELGSNRKTAWQSTPDEIAKEVLRQIRVGIEGGGRRVPEPVAYHIDEGIEFFPAGGVRMNTSRFLVNPPGTWASRPGEPGSYDLMFGSLVLAGTYMKTFTRLTTMEAANESARHAVNAILRSLPEEQRQFIGNFVSVWPIEEREFDDIDFLKKLDEKLVERGLPHFVDIQELDMIPDAWLPQYPWPPRVKETGKEIAYGK
ncbi:FAD-dependent oxidoreductase [Sorangium sp. So ce448]|uniref:FAD-dependent oxidoreductase n=1 Tax=Sorangium sp. So ce448 TaxID=3133314 RepID=UPI003F622D40